MARRKKIATHIDLSEETFRRVQVMLAPYEERAKHLGVANRATVGQRMLEVARLVCLVVETVDEQIGKLERDERIARDRQFAQPHHGHASEAE
jgi:hypothetical protein